MSIIVFKSVGYNGDFFWGGYVRTRFANAKDWVWATAEDFGKGDWLFGEDNPVEFWMPLPGKPEWVVVQHELQPNTYRA